MMKKLVALFVAVAFALSLATLAVAAEEKKSAPAAPAKAEPAKKTEGEKKAEPVKKEAARKPRAQVVTGTIETIDAAAGTLTVKGKKAPVSLKAGEKVTLGDLKVGDKVTVTYSDGTANKIVAARKAAATTKEAAPMKEGATKKEASPTAAPAAPPAKK